MNTDIYESRAAAQAAGVRKESLVELKGPASAVQDIARGVREMREREKSVGTAPKQRPIIHADATKRRIAKIARRKNRSN